MTPEVKKRIDQIRQGIVPEGYKKTESGIIPNEWRVEQVSKCIEEYKFFSNDISHIPVYSSSRKGLVPQSDYYNQREAVETNLGYKVVPQGYVTYRHMSDDDVFHFNINKTGENVLVSSEYPVFTSSDNCDLSFLISVLNNTARFRYFCKMQKLGGTRTRLYLDNLKRYALALPPFDEQKKIAEILATQDKAIELQARKIEELKRFKKGCLEKMFPRKGQKVPEKRFPGFTDDWEQRKLGELGSLKNGMNFSKEAMGIGFPFVNLQNIFGNNVIDVTNLGKAMASDSQLKDYNLLNGDVLFVRSSVKLQGVGEAALVPQNLENTTYSGFIIRFRDEYGLDNNFKRFLFGIESVRNQIIAQATNSANKNISQTVLENLCLKIPNKSEQENIGLYFSNLDKLITLHQRKLEEMKKQKKALMQLLLTGIVRVRL